MTSYNPSSGGSYIPLATLNATADNVKTAWPTPEPAQKTLWERLRTINILILLPGSILLIIPWVLLGVIWRESMIAVSGGEANRFWMLNVHADWTSRLVTVSTAVIRIIITLQASLVTALVGSIIVEKVGTPLYHALFCSIIRAVGGNPSSLLFETGIRLNRPLSLFIYTLISIEVLVTIASQFLSTLLISDFRNGAFTDTTNVTNVSTHSWMGFTQAPWWRVPPAFAWTFPEHSDPFTEGPDFHDTGHTYRAFIPLEDEIQRIRLRKFYGPARVIDNRVICVPPSFADLRLNTSFPPRLYGQMTMGDQSYPMLQNMTAQEPIDFTCGLPFPPENRTEGISSLCYPRQRLTVQMEEPLVNATSNDRAAAWNSTGIYTNPVASTMFLVLDILDAEAMFARNLARVTTPYQVTSTSIHKNGPWSIIANGSDSDALRVSACFTNLVSKTFTVNMTSTWPGLEPKLSWNRSSDSYNTGPVRRQLGASLKPESLHDRGVLSLGPRSQWSDFDIGLNYQDDYENYDIHWHLASTFLKALPNTQQALVPSIQSRADLGVLLSEANTADTSTADRSYIDLFRDILQDTNSPALSLQALLTRGTQMAYYERLLRADPTEPALTAFSSHALIPVQWDGFIAGVVITGTHFIILVLVLVLFVVYTRSSLIGNYWQGVAQVVSGETLPILDQAYAANDEEVKRLAEDQFPQLQDYSVLRYRQNGRIVIGTVHSNDDPPAASG